MKKRDYRNNGLLTEALTCFINTKIDKLYPDPRYIAGWTGIQLGAPKYQPEPMASAAATQSYTQKQTSFHRCQCGRDHFALYGFQPSPPPAPFKNRTAHPHKTPGLETPKPLRGPYYLLHFKEPPHVNGATHTKRATLVCFWYSRTGRVFRVEIPGYKHISEREVRVFWDGNSKLKGLKFMCVLSAVTFNKIYWYDTILIVY